MLIAGNWKMFKGPVEARAFFTDFEAPDGVDVVFCPPYVSLGAAVEHDERYEVEAARQIAAKESGSSEAPPTRAPSIDGCDKSSAAFSGLTEPP